MTALSYPLISGICVTKGKPLMLHRAIQCFLAQTYPNKELVVLFEDDDIATARYMSAIGQMDAIKVITVPKLRSTKLGELRNLAIQVANGKYVCQWDDDDWFHARRMERQYLALAGSDRKGSILMQWLVFDAINGRAYLSNHRPWEGSVFCEKEALTGRAYDNKKAGEDSVVIEYLLSKNLLQAIGNAPHLYIYIYHGHNTWNRRHWKRIFKFSRLLPDQTNRDIQKILSNGYDVAGASSLLDEIARNYENAV